MQCVDVRTIEYVGLWQGRDQIDWNTASIAFDSAGNILVLDPTLRRVHITDKDHMHNSTESIRRLPLLGFGRRGIR